MKILAIAGLAALLVGGCAYTGPAGNSVSRNLTWFSNIGGEDIRKACAPGAIDRYRFVYNGIYDKQIRTYDLHMLPDGRGAALSAWVRSEPDLSKANPILELGSLWGGKRTQSTLPLQGMSSLRAALAADGFQDRRPVDLRLPSNEFYWTAAACVGGRFYTNAWLYPSDRYKALKFPAILNEYDRTGVPFYAAVPVNDRDFDPTHNSGDKFGDEPFVVQLGPNGFVGTDGLL